MLLWTHEVNLSVHEFPTVHIYPSLTHFSSFPEGLFAHSARVTQHSHWCGGAEGELENGVYGNNACYLISVVVVESSAVQLIR